jgi:TM2 domain-containing membrane protein YozV
MVLAYLLWFFAGGVGAHRFYLGRIRTAVAMVVLFLVGLYGWERGFGWAAATVLGLWLLADAFLIPGMARNPPPPQA